MARHFRRAVKVAALLALMAVASGALLLYVWGGDLPSDDALDTYRPPQSTKLYDRKGELVAEFYQERRTVVPMEKIPLHLRQAMVASEDDRFYQHAGLDYLGILRAALTDLKELRLAQGASTITQQVVKNLVLSPEKSFERKVKEALLARRIEQRFTKDQILALYLNHICFGANRYGVEEAARYYFGKPVEQLELGEAAMLAGIVQRPEALSPFAHLKASMERRAYVLGRMEFNGFISHAELERELGTTPRLAAKPGPTVGPYYVEEVRRQLVERFGEEQVQTGGLRVELGMDRRLQREADEALRRGLEAFDKRANAAHDGEPALQGALVAIEPATRRVLAMTGGYNFAKSAFNRATQARRQPGSAFKPFVYAAALESGKYTAASLLADAPELIRDPITGKEWRPDNYEREHFEGTMTLRAALARSKNTVAVRLIEALGDEPVRALAKKAGILSPLPASMTLALGTGEVTPLELANAYATFAALGRVAEPVLIAKVTDAQGRLLDDRVPRTQEAMLPAVAFITTSLMRSVVEEGTATAAKELGRPVVGKTGTTSDHKDAWFAGFTPELAAVTWIGYDAPRSLGAAGTGTRGALPIWLDFMKHALQGMSVTDFEQPEGVEEVRIEPLSGLRAADDISGVVEYFVEGTAPVEKALPPGLADPALLFLQADD